MTMRRTLLIIAAVIVLLGIGVGIYFLFFRGNAALTVGGSLPIGDLAEGEGETETSGAQGLGVPLPGAGTDIAPRLVRVSDRPVALGAVAVYVRGTPPVATTSASSTPIGTEPDVRVEYIERESGNIYAYQAHGRTLTRLSNKTLPGIQEAAWLTDGSLAFVRFLERTGNEEHINTYALPANGTGGYFLAQNLEQVLVKGTSTLATLLSTTDGSSASVSTPSGSGLHSLFATALSSVRMAFSGNNYVVATKGSASMDGSAFTVDGKTGSFTRALGPLPGLSTLASPAGRYVLYSYLDRGKLALGVLDIATHVATRLPLATLPEKCTWTLDDTALYCGVPTNASSTLPDDWYQGATAFSDRLWRIDMTGRVATLIIDPKQTADIDIDAVGMTLDRTNDVLVFTNKRDRLLYVYDL
jgi:hypothetical protein